MLLVVRMGVVPIQVVQSCLGLGSTKKIKHMYNGAHLGSSPPVHDAGQQNGAAESTEKFELLEIVGAFLPKGLGDHSGNQGAKVQKGAELSRLRDGASLGQVQ